MACAWRSAPPAARIIADGGRPRRRPHGHRRRAGTALSLATGRALSTLLFGVEPFDAATIATVSLIVLGTGAAAAYIPARRAASLDPLMSFEVTVERSAALLHVAALIPPWLAS